MSIPEHQFTILPRKTDTADDLALKIERLSKDTSDLRESGPLSFQEVQRITTALTKAQLVLNELERVELQERGDRRDMAERLAVLESRIRTIRDGLYEDLRRRISSVPEGAGVAAGSGRVKDNDNAHDPAG